jgi:hypothetical protein
MLLPEGVGGKIEENNHGAAGFSLSQELGKLVNGNYTPAVTNTRINNKKWC